jgi:hypothetical protein
MPPKLPILFQGQARLLGMIPQHARDAEVAATGRNSGWVSLVRDYPVKRRSLYRSRLSHPQYRQLLHSPRLRTAVALRLPLSLRLGGSF